MEVLFFINEIKFLSSELKVEFGHIIHLENEEVDVLSERGASQ